MLIFFVKGAHVWWAEAGTLYLSMVSQNQGKKKKKKKKQ